MSINHSYKIGDDGHSDLQINISGLDHCSRNIDFLDVNIYASCSKTGSPKFTCTLTMEQLAGLHAYLDQYEMIKDHSRNESGEFIQIKKGQQEISELLKHSDHSQVVLALRTLVKNSLSQDDVNTILGRKEALNEFEERLIRASEYNEPNWQTFLEKNEWIFGYGLRYRYLSILQRESHVSGTHLDGSNSVISDFLMTDNRFTKLVELKRPKTPLFKHKKNRSDSWCLSPELTDAVSQILAQKANWEIESQKTQFTRDGIKVYEDTYDVDCILLIGMTQEFSGDDRDAVIKRKTIELYRRNMRNIDIIFYDELLDRIRFIVKGPNYANSTDTNNAQLISSAIFT